MSTNQTEQERYADGSCETRSYRTLKKEAFNVEERWVDVVCSTPVEDAHEEILEQSWDLARFNANPVVLWEHGKEYGARAAKIPIIGRAEKTRVEDGVLKSRCYFAPKDVSEFADDVFKLVVNEFLRGISVGFRSRNARLEQRDGREIWVLSDNELFEYSFVVIPSNPLGLVEQRRKAFSFQALATKPVAQPPENHMNELELIAKRLGVDAKPDVILAVTDRQSAVISTASEALGLDAKTATPAEFAKAIARLTERAAQADVLAPRVQELEVAAQKAAEDQATREVSYVIKCGIEGVLGVKADERSRKSLMAYRKADPQGFAEDYKTVLDSLKAFDNLKDFKPLTSNGGELSQPSTVAEATRSNVGDSPMSDFESQIAAIQREYKAKTGNELSRVEALARLEME